MVVKFINVHQPYPPLIAHKYLPLPIGKKSERPELFQSALGIGFAQLEEDGSYK
jgi:hypothetical protein